ALEAGRVCAAGDDAAPGDRVPLAGDPRPVDRERGQLLGRALGPDLGDRLGPDEARLLLAAPAEARLDRVAILAEVVAVQVVTDLDPQRVARPEPRGRRAALKQGVPHAGCLARVEQQLDPVLAR